MKVVSRYTFEIKAFNLILRDVKVGEGVRLSNGVYVLRLENTPDQVSVMSEDFIASLIENGIQLRWCK